MSQVLSTIDLPENNEYDYIRPQSSAIENVNSIDSQNVLFGDNIYIDPIPGPSLPDPKVRRPRQTALLYTLCGVVLLLVAAVVGLGVYMVSINHPLYLFRLFVCSLTKNSYKLETFMKDKRSMPIIACSRR